MVRTAELDSPRRSAKPIQVIGFDMGGTSTDVSHYAGEFERAFETQVAGVRMRAPMMSDPHRRRRRRLDPRLRRRALSRRPAERRREPGPGVLPARRAADGDRCQRRWSARSSRRAFRACSARTATSRSTATSSPRRFTALAAEIARATGSSARPRQVAEGFIDIAVGAHGQRDQEDLGRARLRRHPLHAAVLRRRRRSARLPRRRRARHGRACSCTRSPACCRPTAWAWPTRAMMRRGGDRAAARRRRSTRSRRASTRSPPRRVRRARAPGRARAIGSPCTAASTCATKAPIRRSSSPFGDAAELQRGVRGRVPAALRVPDERARA